MEELGKGTFGRVMKVFDHKRKEYNAMKIIKSKRKHFT
jgi:dual specificity tyrosine-phosphorylation-regulated kinase 2/3/4